MSYAKNSTTNPYVNNSLKKQPVEDKFIENRTDLDTKRNREKIAIAAMVPALIALSVFAIKPTSAKPFTNIAEHIDFINADTLKDAITFAKRNWGIDIKEINNLDVANWVNLSLTKLSNVLKGKFTPPATIHYRDIPKAPKDELTLAEIVCSSREMTLNKNFFENIDSDISKTFKMMTELSYIIKGWQSDETFKLMDFYSKKYPELTDLLKKFIKDKNELKFCEKMDLRNALDDMVDRIKNVYNVPKDIQTQIFQDKSNVGTSMLPHNLKMFKIIESLISSKYMQENFITELNSGGNAIFHEIGHLQHYYNFATPKGYSNLRRPTDGKSPTILVKEFLENNEYQKIAGKVSDYAKTAPGEFVAEVYAKLIDNIKMPKDVMDLYKKYNGVIPQI